jgi:hypothetical protein
MQYNITRDGGVPSSVTVFIGAESYIATPAHPNWTRILASIEDPNLSDKDVAGMFNLNIGLSDRFARLSERVTFRNETLYFDGDEVRTILAEQIVMLFINGNDHFRPLVSFLEKLSTNPSGRARDVLWTWMSGKSFSIAEDGDIIGYKAVQPSTGRGGNFIYESQARGHAIVNGQEFHGPIPTLPGVVVEMPRAEIDKSEAECSSGLHVGTWEYARHFGPPIMLRVKVNPRDVVGVPNGYSSSKMRVSRYLVLGEVTEPDHSLLDSTEGYAVRALRDTSTKTTTVKSATKKRSEKKAAKPPVRPVKPRRGTAKTELNTPEKKAAAAKAPAKAPAAPAKKAKVSKAAPPPVKKVVAKSAHSPRTLPQFFEEFTKADFANESVAFKTLQWLAKEWEVSVPAPRGRADYVVALAAASARRRRLVASGKLVKAGRTTTKGR